MIWTWVLLAVAAWSVTALIVGRLVGTSISDADRLAAAGEAWDNGFCHGIDTAHSAVINYRKPWITLSEEHGWDLARDQLAAALDALRDTPDADDTTPATR